MKKRIHQNRGFTLIELLVAMTIVAILVGIALVSYQGARKTARDGRRKADLEQVRSALEMCYTDASSYPLGPLYSGNSISCGGRTYMTIPNDPLTGRRYYYNRLTTSTYELCTALEGGGATVCAASACTVNCNFRLTNP